MVIAKFNNGGCCETYGLYQWDYGQELVIENAEVSIPDGSEVSFYQESLSHMGIVQNNHVLIPDIMLQNTENITAYIYVRGKNSGETILSVVLHIQARPKPDNYVLPEYTDYNRLIPPGGKEGQILAKQTGEDYVTEWRDAETAAFSTMTDAEIDSLFREVII